MRLVFLTLCLAMSVILESCAVPQHVPYFDVDPNAPYTLGSGDRLRIIVFGQDSLSNSYAVDGSGHISMPLIGIVEAEGLTTASLARRIEAQLRNGFLRDPKVSVEVEAYRPFFILGEVTTPGQYPFVSGMTVETAVAIAGGFTPRAFKGGADLNRVIDGQPFTGTIPITQLVRPGDTIYIHERFF
ncbi:polysaccharide biosynthesis/export family protein [Methyloferula stellata]|uniref:polysaccharide biosynthesis/export family protein n=1 Tax=Methyloferula stellata TaxID=876270 RepID=UPI0003667FDC